MAKITLDLNKFKASGVYTIEFDASERIVVTTQTIRLVVGFSRIGPINAPVFLRDINTSRRIFGEIDTFLEKRGSFFHRALETCLSVGPVFALNLMPLKSKPINEGGDATNYRSFALAADEENGPVTRALVTSFYNQERFWFPDAEYVIATQDAKPVNRDYLMTVVNLSQAPLSVLVRKSTNARQYEIAAKDYYGLGNVPDFMNDNDFLSDFFLDLIIVEGDWTNLAVLSQDPNYSKYFDTRGIKADQLDAFLSLDNITLVGAFTGTIIPDFVDNNGSNQNLETIVNAAVGLTGTFIAINNAKIEDYANSLHKIDTIGNTLISTTDDTIDFLSYNTPIKSIVEFTGAEDLNPAGSIDVTTYQNLDNSTSNAFIKSYPFGGASGKFNNVLVLPKPEPGDTTFLPSQYQYILDNLSSNSLILTYGVDTLQTEKPSDYVKVENVIDTGTSIEIQLSTPLHTTTNYEDSFIFTGSATAVPSAANQIAVTDLTPKDDSNGAPHVPQQYDILLVEAPGFYKYYEVQSYVAGSNGGTVTVKDDVANTLSPQAPYYLSRYAGKGLSIDDYSSYVQPADIKVTLFAVDYTATADNYAVTGNATNINANNSVPSQGYNAPFQLSDTRISEISIAFTPTVTVNSFEGIGSLLNPGSVPINPGTGWDSIAATAYNVTQDLTESGPFYLKEINTAAFPSAGTNYVVLVDATGADVDWGAASWASGDTIKITMTQSGVSFTGILDVGLISIEGVDINKLQYIESYSNSKITKSANTGLLVNEDSVKYYSGNSTYNYLGIIKNWSKSATTGEKYIYSQVAYGIKGTKVVQYTDTTLSTRANLTYAELNNTYEDSIVYADGSGTTNDLAVYSSVAKNISSNVEIIGTLYGGGKKFQVSNANSLNLNVGDLIVDSSVTPKLTRVTQKVKKVNPATGAVTYEYTVLDVPAVDTVTNTITKFTPIQQFCDRLQFSLLNGYVLTDYHLPNNTDTQIDKIYSVIENTNIGKTLASRDIISFRYIIDTFNGGIAPQMGPKSILSRLAKNRQKCMAILNAPSIKQFVESTDPRFTELPDPNAGIPKPVLNTDYIATGGNLSLGPSFRFTLPDEDNGAKFIGVFSPNIIIRENNKNKSIPPAADVSNNFVRKFINGQPYSIVAGPRRGVISNPKFAGLEYEFLLQDRENLEPIGINPIVTVKGIGPMIFANQTAYQKTLSAFNNLHVRDLLITIEEAVEDVLAQYLFEFNDASTRLEIRTIVENYLDTVRNAGGVYDFAVIMDETNNTPAIIDQNFGIIDIGLEPARGLQKFINRVTILKTGAISSGGFSAA
jgi:hypothetical protein